MKKINLVLAAIVAIVFAACNGNSPDSPNVSLTDGYFLGKSTVVEPLFVQDSVTVEIADNEDGTRNIVMNNVNFSERMPVTIDMIIPNVTITDEGIISGDNIVPTLKNGVPYDRYLVTDLAGQITYSSGVPSTIKFSLNFGQFPTTYEGEWVK